MWISSKLHQWFTKESYIQSSSERVPHYISMLGLFRRSPDVFDALGMVISKVCSAAETLEELVKGNSAQLDAMRRISSLAQQGNQLAYSLNLRLLKSWILSIDREDVLELSNRLGDILGRIDAISRRIVLLKIETVPARAMRLTEILKQLTEELSGGIRGLNERKDSSPFASKVKHLEKQASETYYLMLESLVTKSSISIGAIKQKEICESLEGAIRLCAEVGRAIERISIKHS